MHRQVVIRSDILSALRRLLTASPALAQALGLPLEIRAVVDTNAIVTDVRFLAMNVRDGGARTSLQEVFASGMVVPYFPAESLSEVEEKLDAVSERYALPPAVLRAIWERYRRALRICVVAGVDADDVVLRDPDDWPFVKLHRLIDAHFIFTSDKDISAAGIPTLDPLVVRGILRDLARATAIHASIEVVGVLSIAGGLVGAVRLARGFAGLVGGAPPVLKFGLAALIIAAIGIPAVRSAIIQRMRPFGRTMASVWSLVGPVLLQLAVDAARAREQSEKLRAQLSATVPQKMNHALAPAPNMPVWRPDVRPVLLVPRRKRSLNPVVQPLRRRQPRRAYRGSRGRLGLNQEVAKTKPKNAEPTIGALGKRRNGQDHVGTSGKAKRKLH
jgi:predicted nucleic acid-binding protein